MDAVRDSSGMVTIRFAIGFKIFAIALALLVLMSVATLLMVRMTREVGTELDFFASTYLPAYASIARTNVRSVERALVLRRLIIASIDTPNTPAALRTLREQFAELGRQTDAELALARARLAERLGRPGGFSDAVAVARLDTRLEQLGEDHRRYEVLASKFLGAFDRAEEDPPPPSSVEMNILPVPSIAVSYMPTLSISSSILE